MSRGEWVTLPVAGQVEPRRFRREDIGDYWPRQFPEGEAVMLMRRHTDLMFTVTLPLAEFEALLFGAAPAEDDAYTRAAVRYAEAEMRVGRLGYNPAAIDERTAAAYEYERLYREKHGG